MNIRFSDATVWIRVFLTILLAIYLSFYIDTLLPWLVDCFVIIIFAADGLDGYLARNFDRESETGGFFDIAGDRVVETLLLIPFTLAGILNPIILIYFISKGFLIDHLRLAQYIQNRQQPFNQISNSVILFIVKSRSIRALYAFLKLTLIILAVHVVHMQDSEMLSIMLTVVSIATVSVSLLRTVPVVLDHYSIL